MTTTEPARQPSVRLLGIDAELSQPEAAFLEAWDQHRGDMRAVARQLSPAVVNIGSRSPRVAKAVKAIIRSRIVVELGSLAYEAYLASLQHKPGSDAPAPSSTQLKVAKDVFDRLGIIPPKAQAEVDPDKSKRIREKTVEELNREIDQLQQERYARQLQAKVIEATAEPVAQG